MKDFIDQHREAFRVESICQSLQVAPLAYWRRAARAGNPALHSVRERRDEMLTPHIERVWHANLRVYGAEKVWRQLLHEGITTVARCTGERLMCRLGLRGAVRGEPVRMMVGD